MTIQDTFSQTFSGTGTGSPVTIANGSSTAEAVTIQVSGTFTAKLYLEGTVFGSGDNNWKMIAGINLSDMSLVTADPYINGAGVYIFCVEGLDRIRINVSSYTSGTITVSGCTYRTV